MDVLPFLHAPLVTSILLAVNVAVIVLTTIDAIHPIQLAFSPSLVFEEKQYWRLLTTFFYHGGIGVDSFFTLMWIQTTSKEIEEEFFTRRSIDYVLTLLAGGCMLLALRIFGVVDGYFLSSMLSTVLMYLYSRVGPNHQVQIMALFEVRLRALPLIYLILSVSLNGVAVMWPSVIAMGVGHVLWFFLDIFPRITGVNPFKVHRRLMDLFNPQPEAAPAMAQ